MPPTTLNSEEPENHPVCGQRWTASNNLTKEDATCRHNEAPRARFTQELAQGGFALLRCLHQLGALGE